MKKLLLHITSLIIALNVSAQKGFFYLNGGLSLFLAGAETSENLTVLPSITIGPGFRLLNTKEFSISADFPVSIGASGDIDDSYFGINAPAILNLNFGYGASLKSTSKFGISLGAGVGYHYSYNEYYDPFYSDEYDDLSLASYVFQSGFFFRDKHPEKGISGGGLRFFYMTNFNQSPIRKNVIGIGLLVKDL